ncbi:MAG: DUF4012 domain-containing protein [Dehalococcoidia bacterium]
MLRRAVRRLVRPRALLALGGVLLVVLVAGGGLAWDAATRARDARASVYAAKAELEQARTTVQALAGLDAGALPSAAEIETALVQIRSAHEHLAAADARLGYLPRLLPVADLLPPANGAAEVPALIAVGLDVTDSADQLLTAVLPLLQESEPGDERSLAERVRAVFVEDGDVLDGALARLEATQPEVARLQAQAWGDWLDTAPGALELLDGALADVPRARAAFGALRTGIDPLFGFDRPKTYVILGQNEAEIRATGGFMGSMGIVTLSEGRVIASRYDQTEAFERPFSEPGHPEPLPELSEYMGAGMWILRDANWYPDFPTSSEAVMDFLRRDQGIEVDGVIAFTTLFMDQLLGVYGPITLPEYQGALAQGTWRGLVEATLQAGGSTPEATYLHPLLEELIERLQATSADELPSLFAALRAGSASRDLQFYATTPAVQEVADAFGVSGRLQRPEEGDFVAVVDSNVSWSKVQPAITRSLLYLAGQDGGSQIVAQWTNRASELDPAEYPRMHAFGELWSWPDFRTTQIPAVFGNYTRFYLPPNATAVTAVGFHRPARLVRTEDFLIVSGLVIVEDGQSASVSVSYVLPEPPSQVSLWKQGGQAFDHVRILQNRGNLQETLLDQPFTGDVVVELAPLSVETVRPR